MRGLLWVFSFFFSLGCIGCSDDAPPIDPIVMDSAVDAVVEDSVPDAETDAAIPLPGLSCESGWVAHALGEPERTAPSARLGRERLPVAPMRLHRGSLSAGEPSVRSDVSEGWWFAHLEPEHARAIESRWREDGVEVTERLGRGVVPFFHRGGANWAGLNLPGVSSARPVDAAEKAHPWLTRAIRSRGVWVSVARYEEGRGLVHESRFLRRSSELETLSGQSTVLSLRATPD